MTKQTTVSIGLAMGLAVLIVSATLWITSNLNAKVDVEALEKAMEKIPHPVSVEDRDKIEQALDLTNSRLGDLTVQVAILTNELKHIREARRSP